MTDDETRQAEADYLRRCGGSDYLPTPAEIAAECERIRAGWTRAQRRHADQTPAARPVEWRDKGVTMRHRGFGVERDRD